jgi:hypothetical protein
MANRGLAPARSRLTYANVVSTLALFLALGGGAAMAKQHFLNGKRIKPGTIPANRIKKHSLTSTQIKVSKLGTVAKATHALTADQATHAAGADTLGGLGPGAFVASDRVIEGTPTSSLHPNTRILLDPATGADVRLTMNGVIEVVNTNATDALSVNGVSSRGNTGPNTLVPQSVEIPAGGSQGFFENAEESYYLDLAVLRVPSSGVPGTVLLHVTCGENINGDDQVDCVGIR